MAAVSPVTDPTPVQAVAPGTASARLLGARVARGTRAAAAVLGVVAVVVAYIGTARQEPTRFVDFFGQFTMQSNLLAALVFAASAAARRPSGRFLADARACVTSYLAITGIVYAVLLGPTLRPGQVAVPWANTVVHVVLPIYAALDFLLVHDRPRLRFRMLWVLSIWPVLWLAVTLVRGATDGWVPYPFLDPATGYGMVAVWVVGIAAVFVGIGALTVLVSRWAPWVHREPGGAQPVDNLRA